MAMCGRAMCPGSRARCGAPPSQTQLDADLVERLLKRGAKAATQNRFGATPLGEGAKAANLKIVQQLLKAGAPVDAANGDGETALMLAARTGSVEVVSALIGAGANVN